MTIEGKVVQAVLGMLLGLILVVSGLTILTWGFWAVLGVVSLMILNVGRDFNN